MTSLRGSVENRGCTAYLVNVQPRSTDVVFVVQCKYAVFAAQEVRRDTWPFGLIEPEHSRNFIREFSISENQS